jgi:sarcosine oxidase subunit alpha
VVKLEAGDFLGGTPLRAELEGGIGRRMVTLVIAGDEAPDYGSTVLSHGRGVGRLTSPSAGRSPSVDRVIGLAVVETEVAEVGTRLEVALPDGRTVPATVAGVPIHDPDKQRPRA